MVEQKIQTSINQFKRLTKLYRRIIKLIDEEKLTNSELDWITEMQIRNLILKKTPLGNICLNNLYEEDKNE